MNDLFLCRVCDGVLRDVGGRLDCGVCGKSHGVVEDGITVFDGTEDKANFFDRRAADKLAARYEDYNRMAFLDSLKRTTLWEMDSNNKKIGITKKYWWEPHIGRIANKSVLEVGCGVNYLLPYWVETGNRVVAFDVCKGNVILSRRVLKMVGLSENGVEFAVADAQTARFNRAFDVISINNVLHHISDKKMVFRRMRECLADDGKLLLVEPNYYYPPRWVVETDAFDPFNFVKQSFIRNELIEEGEKAVVFSEFKTDLIAAGFRIDANDKDANYLGYFTTHWLPTDSQLARLIYYLDRWVLSPVLPRVMAPFEYIIAGKA